ncbi:MAG: signal peptide peptidase SppA [Lachnospiraceae bacterium]|nr:signal peptide peptidase SppA [Lachnospiraceae bacterium]
MKKKQVIAGVIAAILFVFIGATSVGMNILDKVVMNAAGISSDTMDSSYAYGFPIGDFMGIVKIDGDMMESADSSYFSTGGYNHDATIDYIEALAEADNNVGILLYVNSGGGYTYIGDDLYLELMEYKEETGRPIYAYFDSIAASAAYYAAMSADEIYANRMTTTGSIGVYMTVYDMTELYNKLGIKEYMIKSGDNKGIGGGGQAVTEEYIAIEQAQIDEMYELFVDIIEKGRGMNREDIYAIADGRTFTANQALELDLIDGIARYEDYKEQVLGYMGDGVVYHEQSNEVDPFTAMFGSVINAIPKSDNQAILEFIESNESGVTHYESICY